MKEYYKGDYQYVKKIDRITGKINLLWYWIDIWKFGSIGYQKIFQTLRVLSPSSFFALYTLYIMRNI